MTKRLISDLSLIALTNEQNLFFITFKYSPSYINSPLSLYSFPFPCLFPFKYLPSNNNLSLLYSFPFPL